MSRRKTKSLRSSACALLWAVATTPAFANDVLDTMVHAYPQTLSGRTGNALNFRDGTHLDAGMLHKDASLDWVLGHASVRDQFFFLYPRATQLQQPPPIFDPGRLRDRTFFDAMYGDCRKGETEKSLVSVIWLAHDWGRAVRVTRINGVDAELRAVSQDIEKLAPEVRRAAWPIEGDYECRNVADGGQPSMHAYGAAVDLNLHYSNYWLWETDRHARTIAWRNRMPGAIVDAFERHGFIWGGRWYHYDTMHFEYRPELLAVPRD